MAFALIHGSLASRRFSATRRRVPDTPLSGDDENSRVHQFYWLAKDTREAPCLARLAGLVRARESEVKAWEAWGARDADNL
jgi:hypothetical protein